MPCGLKQHRLILCSSLGLATGLPGPNQGVDRAVTPGGSERSCLLLIWVIGRMQLLEVIGWDFHGCSQTCVAEICITAAHIPTEGNKVLLSSCFSSQTANAFPRAI